MERVETNMGRHFRPHSDGEGVMTNEDKAELRWEDISTWTPKAAAHWPYLEALIVVDGKVMAADWQPGAKPPKSGKWWPANLDSEYGSQVFPTHWMPLPPPPSVSTGPRPQEAVPTEQADGSVLVPIGWMQGVWNMGSDALKRLPRDPQGALVSLTGAMMALHAVMPTQPIPQPAEGCSSNEGAGQ
jgi:hypothetical protein